MALQVHESERAENLTNFDSCSCGTSDKADISVN